MIPRRLLFAATLAVATATAAAPRAETHVVQCTTDSGFEPRFIPAEKTVLPGDTVRWVNTDSFLLDHGTVSGTGSADPLAGAIWDSGVLHSGDWFEMTFNEVGVFEYFSPPHEYEGMTGTIRVGTATGTDGEVEQSTWGKIKEQFNDLLPR
ncbi:MAG TPA: plastocyanin/azurin family copper-binding protein [bacterium]|nr:plastocyanin/azurin family copper-binding protein [bacterium]